MPRRNSSSIAADLATNMDRLSFPLEGEEDEMTAGSELIALELPFGWLWIIAGLVAIVCLIGALFGGLPPRPRVARSLSTTWH